MRIICTPTRDNVTAGFAFDLAQLVSKHPETMFTVCQGSLLSNLRTSLVDAAIAGHFAKTIFIDSDMRFPPDTVQRLIDRKVDIIGANCKQRTQDQWTARKDDQFISSIGKTGIEEVDTIGFGVTLIRTEVFLRLVKPWFAIPWDTSVNKHVGEDVYFCHMAREAGYKIYVDHDLSQEVKHSGAIEFGI